MGNIYPLATNINQLDSQITVLDLRGHNCKELSSIIFKQSQLKILLLQANLLTKIPIEIAQLTNLKELNLKDNQLSEQEKLKIKTLLPNCKIEF